ncbi:MAG: ketoacyl-ACP synthase III [Gammaproteobacteria bacterium]|nr:ketoacyl-ACP synthase III [Gammaproteobacteria bacterium]
MSVRSYILGTGSYLPETVLTNEALSTKLDTSDEWIFSRTGIKQRHIAGDDESTSDLAEYAAKAALEDAGIDPQEIDLIIVATTTPTHIFPSCATGLQRRLGASTCPSFDVQAVCSGFVYALDIADKYIRTGQAKNALVVGADCMSKILNWEDRNTCVLFGDGAGAVVLSARDDHEGIIASKLYSDGKYKELLWVPNGPSWKKSDDRVDCYLQMAGSEVFKVAVSELRNLVGNVLADVEYKAEDIDKLVPHQANIRIINSVAEKLKLPMHKVVTTVQNHANTSAASIPLAFDHAVKTNQINRGDLVFMEAFGGGFTWGGQLVRF